MAKKSRRGVKTYRPYGPAVFTYAIFALLVVACFGVFAILPMFHFVEEGQEPIAFKGYEFVIYTIRRFFSSLSQPKFVTFASYFEGATPSNQLLATICKIHDFIELGLGALFTLTAIWALVEALLSLGFMIFGQSKHPKSLDIFAWLTFWFFVAAFGLSFMYFFFYMQITGDAVKVNISLLSLASIGAMLVVCIILAIIYKFGFKNRVAFAGKKGKEKTATIEDAGTANPQENVQPSPAPANQQTQVVPEPVPAPAPESSPEQVQENTEEFFNQEEQPEPVPASNPETTPTPSPAQTGSDVITVGRLAYAKNTEISSASIPEGITSLGSCAFANCTNLHSVIIPSTIQEIGFNAFLNTPRLIDITFNGTINQWKTIKRGSNWLSKSGTKTVKCLDGQINVNPRH